VDEILSKSDGWHVERDGHRSTKVKAGTLPPATLASPSAEKLPTTFALPSTDNVLCNVVCPVTVSTPPTFAALLAEKVSSTVAVPRTSRFSSNNVFPDTPRVPVIFVGAVICSRLASISVSSPDAIERVVAASKAMAPVVSVNIVVAFKKKLPYKDVFPTTVKAPGEGLSPSGNDGEISQGLSTVR
jgi:hypothetical protein